LEDKEAILAECRLKYEDKDYGDVRWDTTDKASRMQAERVRLCMQTKGLSFEAMYSTDEKEVLIPNNRCWYVDLAMPVAPVYLNSNCYHPASRVDLLKQ
jgi:hypothetical protein